MTKQVLFIKTCSVGNVYNNNVNECNNNNNNFASVILRFFNFFWNKFWGCGIFFPTFFNKIITFSLRNVKNIYIYIHLTTTHCINDRAFSMTFVSNKNSL